MDHNDRVDAQSAALPTGPPDCAMRLNELLGENGPVVWEIVSDGESCRVEFMSDSARSLLGYDLAQWYARAEFAFEVMHPDDRASVRPQLLRQVRAGQDGSARFRLIARDGRVIWVETSWRVTPAAPRLLEVAAVPMRVRGLTNDITAIVQAEAAASRSNELLDAIAQGTSDLVFMKDIQGRYSFANRAKAAALGRPAQDIIGKTAADIYAPELARAMNESDARTLEWGETFTYESTAVRPDGERVYLMSKTPIRDEAGKVVGLVGIGHDITEREAARERIAQLNEDLQRQLDELAILLEVVPIGIGISHDARCERIHYNAKLSHWLELESAPEGVTKDGATLRIFAEGRELTMAEYPLRRSAAHGVEVSGVELRVSAPSGAEYSLLAYAAPIFSSEGLARGAIGAYFDVTEIRRAESRERFLSEANRLLAHSLDYLATLDLVAHLAVPTLADCCFVHLMDDEDQGLRDDRNIRLLAVAHTDSKQEELIWELHRRFPLDFNITAGIPRVCRTGVAELHGTLDLGENSSYAHDADHLRVVRALGFCSAMVVPLMARDRILGTVSFACGPSERRFARADLDIAQRLVERAAIAIDNARLFREADSARREAEAANRTKDEFLATLSHELRTPLSAIAGWVYLLRQGRLDAATATKAYESIERSAQAQTQLVEDLLDVSRIVSGKLRLDLLPISLGNTVMAAADTVRPAARAKHIDFQMDVKPAATPVLGDSQRLQQVVWNLLSNAIKFTSDGGTVRVGVEEDGEIAEVVVKDNGIGIAPEFLPFVFQRFRQADSTTTRRYNGLGLGLALVRHLVEMHGGTVQVESEGVGRGTTFRVRLPLVALPLEEAPAGPIPPGAPAERARTEGDATTILEGVRVLLVDDEPDALVVAEEVLARAGAEVRTADSAVMAVAILEQWQPHALVCDIGMPNEDGYALIERIRAGYPGWSAPAIALTAYARDADRMRTAAAGFLAHLTKPVHAETLCEVVRGVVGRVPKS